MRSRTIFAVILAASACSSSEPLPVEIPLTTSGILALTASGRTRAWALDPDHAGPALPPLEAWDGAPLELALAEVDLALVGMTPGAVLGPAVGIPTRTIADRQLAASDLRIRVRTLRDEEDSGWLTTSELPSAIGGLALADDSPCRGASVKVVSTSTTGFSFTDVAIIPAHDGVTRAIVASDRRGGPAGAPGGLGVVTSTDARPTTHPLTWPDASPRNLRWDGRETVWASILQGDRPMQRVVQLDLAGHERASLLLPQDDGDALRFVFTWDGRVMAVSPGYVLELTTGSTRSVDRAADYPRRLQALLEVAPDRRLAIDTDGAVYHWRRGEWVEETRALPGAMRLFLVEDTIYAISREALFVRADDGTWRTLTDPFPTINKQTVSSWAPGSIALSGGAGLLAAYRPSYGWCTVTVLGTRQLRDLDVLDGRGVAMEYFDDGGTRGPTLLYWIELPP